MDGIHDLGGKHGFGEVDHQPAAPAFHARWEAAVFAMVNAAAQAGAWQNTDQFRHGVERIDPVAYLSHGYYGRWLGGLETLLVESGLITTEALNQRLAQLGGDPGSRIAARPLQQPDPQGPGRAGPGSQRALAGEAAYPLGTVVRTVTRVSDGHTRLPAYARGKQGIITALHGGWVYPDTNAHGQGECPQHLYTVAFQGAELWPGGDPLVTVSLDLFEPYLTPAAGDLAAHPGVSDE